MQPQAPASAVPFPTAPEVIFTNWREALHRSGLTSGMQAVYTLAVSGYLEYCSRNIVSVTKASAQAYMGDVIRRGLAKHPELWKDGLNWFFREGLGHVGVATTQIYTHVMNRPGLGLKSPLDCLWKGCGSLGEPGTSRVQDAPKTVPGLILNPPVEVSSTGIRASLSEPSPAKRLNTCGRAKNQIPVSCQFSS